MMCALVGQKSRRHVLNCSKSVEGWCWSCQKTCCTSVERGNNKFAKLAAGLGHQIPDQNKRHGLIQHTQNHLGLQLYILDKVGVGAFGGSTVPTEPEEAGWSPSSGSLLGLHTPINRRSKLTTSATGQVDHCTCDFGQSNHRILRVGRLHHLLRNWWKSALMQLLDIMQLSTFHFPTLQHMPALFGKYC